MAVWGYAALAIVPYAGCAKHAAAPVVVSQQMMNSDMLQRVRSEAASQCEADGGMKAISWAYDTAPILPLGSPNEQSLVPLDDLPEKVLAELLKHSTRDEYEVHEGMLSASKAAPMPYQHHTDSGPTKAIYFCNDGVEKFSVYYTFLP